MVEETKQIAVGLGFLIMIITLIVALFNSISEMLNAMYTISLINAAYQHNILKFIPDMSLSLIIIILICLILFCSSLFLKLGLLASSEEVGIDLLEKKIFKLNKQKFLPLYENIEYYWELSKELNDKICLKIMDRVNKKFRFYLDKGEITNTEYDFLLLFLMCVYARLSRFRIREFLLEPKKLEFTYLTGIAERLNYNPLPYADDEIMDML
jgi:hypothetical protein